MMRLVATLLALGFAWSAAAADPAKVLRIASPDIDTLDPHAYTEDPSFRVIQAIFEPLYEWDYLASPPKLTPLTAAAPVDVSDDGKTWTIRMKRGIRFNDDPAFGGKARELNAEDYVYSYKRWLDPNGRRGGAPILADLIVGARPVVDDARVKNRFDFDRPIEGMRALDRYTLQLKLVEPNYPNVRDMLGFVGAVAREVVEAAGTEVRTRPVGTGPFRLREWKRGSRLVLEANPAYREARFPESGDPAHAALVRSMQGKKLPQIGTIEISVIDEDLTRLLQFEQGGLDIVELRGEIATRPLVHDALKPEYAARGIARQVHAEPFLFSAYFNTQDPVLGGMSNERIALRRAIALAWDTETLIKVVYAGQAIPAAQMVPPDVGGHDPTVPPKTRYAPATANALLDRFGYRVRDKDGYRTAPDGSPLSLTLSLRAGAISREIQTLWKRNMDAIGLRMEYRIAPFQDIIKELENGKFQIYQGGFGGSPSGYPELLQLYSKQPQRINATQFKLAEYDRAAERFVRAGTDREQIAAARTMNELAWMYMPLMPVLFRLESHYLQPWVLGYSPPRFSSYWKYLDIDIERRRRANGKSGS